MTRLKTLVKAVCVAGRRHWPLLLIFAVWLVTFWPLLCGEKVVGYRDSAYLYYPYFQWIDCQWQQGEIPLWNPFCDLGYSVVGDGTSSVFYPGKLIFLIRYLSYPSRYGVYLSGHVLWAAITTYAFSRSLGSTAFGAGLSAVAYAFGGSVLFQLTNVVYLVSASWLPLGLLTIWKMSSRYRSRYPTELSIVAAMMILGGDPQMAFMLGAIAVATLAYRLLLIGKRQLSRLFFAALGRKLMLLATFSTFAFGLAAIQILPSYTWSQYSVRTQELPETVSKSTAPQPGSHLHAVYEFSQPPWALSELIWPNVSGKPYPIYGRWTDALAGADRIWTPSLYVGFVTIVLAMSQFGFAGRSNKRVWLTWLFVFFAFASLGWYGPVWFWRECSAAIGVEPGISENWGGQVGGVYWLMTIAIPGFDAFRYPAKMFTIASLAMCVLAGLADTERERLLNRRAVILLIGFGLLSVLALFNVGFFEEFVKNQRWNHRDLFFGPFDYAQLRQQLTGSFGTTAAIAAIVLVSWRATRSRASTGLFQLFIMAVLFSDLLFANSWMTALVDKHEFTRDIAVTADLNQRDQPLLKRLRFCSKVPNTWRQHSSPNRLEEIVQWQRQTLHPKHHLTIADDCRLELNGSFTTIEHLATARWRTYISGAGSAQLNGTCRYDQQSQCATLTWSNHKNTKFLLLPSLPSTLDDAHWPMIRKSMSGSENQIELLNYQANRFSLQVDSPDGGTLICNMLPDRGWKAKIVTEDHDGYAADLRIIDDFFLGVELPPGAVKVNFDYQPREFWVGLLICLFSWGSVTAWMAIKCRFSRRLFRMSRFY